MKRLRGFLLAMLFILLPLSLLATDIEVTWNANVETDVKGYKVYVGTATGVYSAPVDVGKVTSYTIKNVSLLTKYYVALTAYNDYAESVKSDETNVTTPPAAPATPTAVTGVKSFTLTWAAVTGASGYKVYVGTATGVYGTGIDVGSVLTYKVTGLLDNTTYYAKISAYGSTGSESYLNDAEVIIKTIDISPPSKPKAPGLKVIK